ncbi:hypothetical protein [Dickeya zeae]|uniref:hypothetical protein n=1 Tax=Dickeya zeae TaxID=204042 RepID=UPI00126839B4|nr:hypothetical protein [Dickeya zeae]UJR53256.1 hypothetical protein J417_03840 [Dickeya zeae MS1]
MGEPLDKLISKLSSYIDVLKKMDIRNRSIEVFPNKNKLYSNDDVQIKIIIEQGEKLLSLSSQDFLFGLNVHQNDKNVLLEFFLSDLEQFTTEKRIYLGEKQIFMYAQSTISEHAFFHLAASPLLPTTYATIHQHAGQAFNVYSIPFKIRVSLENKLKSIIGFKSLDVEKLNGDKIESYDFPFLYVINELIYLKCLDLPCSLDNVKNIYQWSCGFCHTGDKEPMWLLLKALEIISPLFVYEFQKMYEIDITELWCKGGLSNNDILEKIIKYKGFIHPVYYFKDDWSISKLQSILNSPSCNRKKYKRKDAKEVIFNLSETELNEVPSYWCSRTKNHY